MLIHKFVLAIIWGPTADEMGAEDRGAEGRETQTPVSSMG